MASAKRSALLLYHSKIQVLHRETEVLAIAELKIWEVPISDHYPEGRKYSLFLVSSESGEVILGFDNHKPKGPHLHHGGIEKFYEFRGVEELVDDFWRLVKEEGFLI